MALAPAATRLLRIDELAVQLWLHTADEPSAELWTHAITSAKDFLREHHLPLSSYRSLVITDGGAPNAKQRGQMQNDLALGKGLRTAVLTTALVSPIKRGIATALQWLNPEIAFFQPEQAPRALAHLGLEGAWPQIVPHYNMLQGEVPPVEALRTVKRVLGS